jgi:hypothetical protein
VIGEFPAMKIRALAEGLGFPEGPVALAPSRRSEASPVGMTRAELAPEDGSVLLVEIFAGTLVRVSAGRDKNDRRTTGRRPERRRARSGRQVLYLQQWRLPMAHRGVAPAAADAGR